MKQEAKEVPHPCGTGRNPRRYTGEHVNGSARTSPVTLLGRWAADYVAHLATFHQAVKSADPDAAVVLGGCPPGVFSASDEPDAERDFFLQVIEEGRDAYDVFDVHLYGDPYLIPGAIEDVRAAVGDKTIVAGEYNGPVPTQYPEAFEQLAEVIEAGGIQPWHRLTVEDLREGRLTTDSRSRRLIPRAAFRRLRGSSRLACWRSRAALARACSLRAATRSPYWAPRATRAAAPPQAPCHTASRRTTPRPAATVVFLRAGPLGAAGARCAARALVGCGGNRRFTLGRSSRMAGDRRFARGRSLSTPGHRHQAASRACGSCQPG
ncbi:hypothetical protein [Nonomuraea jabiensis]|uniref:Uncharacterized protein n=1 Tax=Nonomuraea jabiensis TaxID=882448 RepID=A0A7W9GB50_9ACTN|nr:hypothetical protein [Nonomuraea jabiensis]MBB5780511.1 hypothetical protein [Nonomuraea jabiensis]